MKTYTHSAHSTFSIYYHFVIIPKYRRPILIEKVQQNLYELINFFCTKEPVEIVSLAIQPNHVHLLISASPTLKPSDFIGRLKQKTCKWLFRNFPDHLAHQIESGHLWARGYFVTTDTVNSEIVKNYIQNQIEIEDPF